MDSDPITSVVAQLRTSSGEGIRLLQEYACLHRRLESLCSCRNITWDRTPNVALDMARMVDALRDKLDHVIKENKELEARNAAPEQVTKQPETPGVPIFEAAMSLRALLKEKSRQNVCPGIYGVEVIPGKNDEPSYLAILCNAQFGVADYEAVLRGGTWEGYDIRLEGIQGLSL